MRSFGFRLTSLVAILWTGIGSTSWALGYYRDAVETVYVMPTSVSVPVATSYVISTSRVVPTAYAVPTYYTTAYWMDPVVVAQPMYAETAYVRRGGLFGRRWVVERPALATTYATSYMPTTFYTPTTVYRSTSYAVVDPLVIPSSYVASADCPCPTTLASSAPAYSAPARDGGGGGARSLRSEPEDRRTMDSAVEPPPENPNPANRGGGLGESGVGAAESESTNEPAMPDRVRDTSPPAPPAAVPPVRNQPSGSNVRPSNPNPGAPTSGAAGAQAPSGNTATPAPPTAPAEPAVDPGALPPITPSGPGRRDSLKPSTYAIRPVPEYMRNVLVGSVRSRSGGDLEEGVRISLRKAGTGTRKETITNALGNFAVRLNDGDWDVDVTMPSGRVYVVSRLRVGDGLIVDSLGRRVPSLEITR